MEEKTGEECFHNVKKHTKTKRLKVFHQKKEKGVSRKKNTHHSNMKVMIYYCLLFFQCHVVMEFLLSSPDKISLNVKPGINLKIHYLS